MRKKRILVYGCFGYFNNQLDGQTIKTRAIYDLLCERYDGKVSYCDSLEFGSNKKVMFKFLKELLNCSHLVFIGAGNSLRYVFPLVFILSKILNFKITDVVVGGWLNEKLVKWPIHRWMFKRINGILTQNNDLVIQLATECRVIGAERMVNFREEVPYEPPVHEQGKLKLVYMARIHKMKGLDSIATLANYISTKDLKNSVSIDFYGQIHEPDRDFFFNNLVDAYPFIQYKGHLAPKNIVATLHKYDTMLLPTHYYTEGFPGSILDAYRSGLPVIVTKWKYAEEFVTDGKTGYIIPFENCETRLCDVVEMLSCNEDCLNSLKYSSYQESLKYTPTKAWEVMEKYLK